MDIKDLIGLSQPLTKLIEVVSNGVGSVFKPYYIRKTANAKAYEIEKIAEIIHIKSDGNIEIGYEDEKVRIKSANELPDSPIYDSLEQRALNRMIYQEVRNQINIERIVQFAAELLLEEQIVSNEKLDEDWVSRFFSIAEDVTSEEMQALWGKVLAGEVKKPNSFSLRTLELLRNITADEAQVFDKIGQLAIYKESEAFVGYLRDNYLDQEQNISFLECLQLKDLGLISSSDLLFKLIKSDIEITSIFIYGDRCVLVTRAAGISDQLIDAMHFTTMGKELLSLLDKKPNEKYLRDFARLWVKDGVSVGIADISGRDAGGIYHENLEILT